MIVVKLKGGLGNQMFQYAFGRCLAEQNQDELLLDLTFLLDRMPRRMVYRDYDLDIFQIQPRVTPLSRLARAASIPLLYDQLSRTISRLRMAAGTLAYIPEKIFGFNPDLLQLTGNLYLDGYWQSERYFESVADLIRAEFRSFRNSIEPESRELATAISETQSVCLNVRRGDFVTLGVSTHGFVGLDYYRKGMEIITERVDRPHVFIFSDDVDWCKENLKLTCSHTFVGHNHAGAKFSSYLQLMSYCKHFVIPNSSFAWWAAWLSNSVKKTVIAPRRWFKDPSLTAEGLLCQSWIAI